MQLHEIDIGPEADQPSSDSITLTVFSDDDEISPKMRELLDLIFEAQSVAEVRSILSVYIPDMVDGTVI